VNSSTKCCDGMITAANIHKTSNSSLYSFWTWVFLHNHLHRYWQKINSKTNQTNPNKIKIKIKRFLSTTFGQQLHNERQKKILEKLLKIHMHTNIIPINKTFIHTQHISNLSIQNQNIRPQRLASAAGWPKKLAKVPVMTWGRIWIMPEPTDLQLSGLAMNKRTHWSTHRQHDLSTA